MTATVQLYAGPLDGLLLTVPGETLDPPTILRFPVPPARTASVYATAPDEAPPPDVAEYARHPSPQDDGPLWRYVYRTRT